MHTIILHGFLWFFMVALNSTSYLWVANVLNESYGWQVHKNGTPVGAINPLTAGSIYICTMNRLRIAARSALHIYIKGTSPTLLESAFDTLSPSASGLGIGHTRTKIRPFKHGS